MAAAVASTPVVALLLVLHEGGVGRGRFRYHRCCRTSHLRPEPDLGAARSSGGGRGGVEGGTSPGRRPRCRGAAAGSDLGVHRGRSGCQPPDGVRAVSQQRASRPLRQVEQGRNPSWLDGCGAASSMTGLGADRTPVVIGRDLGRTLNGADTVRQVDPVGGRAEPAVRRTAGWHRLNRAESAEHGERPQRRVLRDAEVVGHGSDARRRRVRAGSAAEGDVLEHRPGQRPEGAASRPGVCAHHQDSRAEPAAIGGDQRRLRPRRARPACRPCR